MPSATTHGGPTPPPSTQAQPTPARGQDAIQLSWRQPKGLISLSFINFFLRIITLGIYAFWARTEVRKRIWSGVRLNGEPLHYTGTGGELFKGFVIIFFLVIIPLLLVSVAGILIFGPETPGQQIVDLAVFATIFFLFGIGIYRAWRYRLSRTRWRGIRAALVGSDTHYAGQFFASGILIPLTLGWIVPWRTTRLQHLITNDTRFGNRPFKLTASAAPLYSPFAVLWIGGVCILIAGYYALWYFNPPTQLLIRSQQPGGMPEMAVIMWFVKFYILAGVAFLIYTILSAWYRARQFNHFANHTLFESGKFSGSMRWLSLLWVTVSNYLLVFLTLGLLTPIAQARIMRYTIEHLDFVGTAPLEAIAQSAEAEPNLGEGLAQAFDIDGF